MANQDEKDLLLSEQNKQQNALQLNAQQQMANTQQQLTNVMNNKPANYQSTYTDQINGLYNEIMNRPKFNYSVNDDPLYQQYKQQYMSQGKQAMRDTTAQAAALTGGYGNSYGAAAGNQAYQGYLEKLNAAVPELYDRAYTRYQNEGNDMLTRLNTAQTMDNTDYSRWGDQYNQWAAERDAAQSAYDNSLRYGADYQTSYYNMAMSMLQNGVTPSADILSAAGLTEADAKAILKKLNTSSSADQGSGDQKNIYDVFKSQYNSSRFGSKNSSDNTSNTPLNKQVLESNGTTMYVLNNLMKKMQGEK